MQRINLPPEYQLMSPLDQCETIGLIIPPERVQKQSIIKYLIIGSVITISLGLIIHYVKNKFTEPTQKNIDRIA